MAGLYAVGMSDVSQKLCAALGLDYLSVSKIVIEVAYDDMVLVYVKGLITQEQLARCTEAIRLVPVHEVQVSDDCVVRAVVREDCRHGKDSGAG